MSDPHLVAPGMWVLGQGDGSWGQNNNVLIAGRDRALLVDVRLTSARTAELLDTVSRLVGELPIVVGLTHAHGDHTNGLSLLAEETLVIGGTGARNTMRNMPFASRVMFPHAPLTDLTPRLPSLCFDGKIEIDLGGRTVLATEVGAGHSTSDTIFEVSDADVLICGDIHFEGGTPYVATGSATGALQQLDEVLARPQSRIVPGHGPVCDKASLLTSREYLQWVIQLSGSVTGDIYLDAARLAERCRHHRFAGLFNPERLVGNLQRAALDQTGVAAGTGLDIPRMVHQMAALAGRSVLSELC